MNTYLGLRASILKHILETLLLDPMEIALRDKSVSIAGIQRQNLSGSRMVHPNAQENKLTYWVRIHDSILVQKEFIESENEDRL